MNSKKLMIAFIAVSVAALIVSSFAVFAVARTYSTALLKNDTEGKSEDIAPPEISASVPAETVFCDDTSADTGEKETTPDVTSGQTQAVTAETTAEEENEAIPITDGTTAVGFTLSLSEDRLIILSPDGVRVYERIIDRSDLREKDRNALLSGINFEGLSEAMSAIYDLIS